MMEIIITVLIQVVTDIPALWVTGWTAAVLFLAGVREFSLLHCPNHLWGPPSFLSSGYWGSYPRDKMAGHENDNSHPASAKLKNGGTIPPPPIHLHYIVLN
jgi:hypothetical protein